MFVRPLNGSFIRIMGEEVARDRAREKINPALYIGRIRLTKSERRIVQGGRGESSTRVTLSAVIKGRSR